MKKPSVYISCPITESWDTVLLPVKKAVEKQVYASVDVQFWKRGLEYDSTMLSEASAVVIVLPELSWSMTPKKIPTGVSKEIGRAQTLGIKVFLAYKLLSTGEICIYETTSMPCSFSGVGGTATIFKQHMKNKVREYEAQDIVSTESNPCLEMQISGSVSYESLADALTDIKSSRKISDMYDMYQKHYSTNKPSFRYPTLDRKALPLLITF